MAQYIRGNGIMLCRDNAFNPHPCEVHIKQQQQHAQSQHARIQLVILCAESVKQQVAVNLGFYKNEVDE